MRVWITLSLACAFAIFAFAATAGMGGSMPVSFAVAVVGAALVGWVLFQRSILSLSGEKTAAGFNILCGLATLAALVQLTVLCVFIVKPAHTGFAIGPHRGFSIPEEHSCVSSYYVAARSISSSPNVYADELYSLPYQSSTAMRTPLHLGFFAVDVYEYPPPFLLIPRALLVLAPDFMRFRMVWFALNGLVLLTGVLVVARFLGPLAGTRALVLSPLVVASMLTINTLQVGNLQAIIFSIAMMAMVLLCKHRSIAGSATGGALLAYAILSKLFPGILLVYFLVRREWRAVACTTGMMAVLFGISVIDTGWAPYKAFLTHLPRLLSGESFPAFRNLNAVAANYSVPGMAYKLRLFGFSGVSFGAMRVVGWIFTLVLLAATIVVARKKLNQEHQPLVWLGILILASLRSPFLPGYAVIPAVWLLSLLGATVAPTARTAWVLLLAWVCLNAASWQAIQDPRLLSGLLLLPQAMILVVTLLSFRTRSDRTHDVPSERGFVPSLPTESALPAN